MERSLARASREVEGGVRKPDTPVARGWSSLYCGCVGKAVVEVGKGKQCTEQYLEGKDTLLEAHEVAMSCRRNQGIPRMSG